MRLPYSFCLICFASVNIFSFSSGRSHSNNTAASLCVSPLQSAARSIRELINSLLCLFSCAKRSVSLISSSSINSVAFSECLLYIYVFPLTFLYCRRDLLRVHIQYASYDWKDILCIRLLHHRYRFYHHTACISFSQLPD